MKLKRTNKNTSKKPSLIIALSIAAVLLLGVSAYAIYRKATSNDTRGEYDTSLERSDTEKAASEALQDDPGKKLENEQTDTPATPETSPETGKAVANVLVSGVDIANGTLTARGMVSNIVEDGGTCTFVFTKGSNTVTKTSETLPSPTSMSCKTISFPSDELKVSGTWSLKITYSSATSEGTSSAKEFNK